MARIAAFLGIKTEDPGQAVEQETPAEADPEALAHGLGLPVFHGAKRQMMTAEEYLALRA